MAEHRIIDDRPDDEAGIHAFERGIDDEVRAMQRESQLVEDDIVETRKHWESMRANPAIPGARPREDSPDPASFDDVAGDWEGTARAAEEGGQG
jgi:hypothetical protein